MNWIEFIFYEFWILNQFKILLIHLIVNVTRYNLDVFQDLKCNILFDIKKVQSSGIGTLKWINDKSHFSQRILKYLPLYLNVIEKFFILFEILLITNDWFNRIIILSRLFDYIQSLYQMILINFYLLVFWLKLRDNLFFNFGEIQN